MSGRDDSALAERLRGYLAVADAASAAMGAVREAGPTKYADRTIDERCAWLDAHDAENGAWDRLTEWAHDNAEDLARWALAEHERAERVTATLGDLRLACDLTDLALVDPEALKRADAALAGDDS